MIRRLNLPLKGNDGLPNAEEIYLRADKSGTSVIRDGSLYTDAAGVNPKNFKLIRPDYSGGGFFVEVKGDVSGDSWEGLSRDALNDNLRFALLRMGRGAIADRSAEYRDLDRSLQKIVDEALAPFPRSRPDARVYLRWEELKRLVVSPNENLQRTVLDLSGRRLPIKVIAGGREAESPPLYILDSEIMGEWQAVLR